MFLPKVSRQRARVDALKHLLQTFFDGSAVDAATALVDGSASKLTSNELDRLEELIRNARKGTEAGKEHHS
jgi:predicted transcriptional regulator